MRRIDALLMAWPLLGSRRLTAMLLADGLAINRKRVRRLMRLMGIAGPKLRTKPPPGHKIFPYLSPPGNRPAKPGAGPISPTSRSAAASLQDDPHARRDNDNNNNKRFAGVIEEDGAGQLPIKNDASWSRAWRSLQVISPTSPFSPRNLAVAMVSVALLQRRLRR
jgi:helix-turn-helix protein